MGIPCETVWLPAGFSQSAELQREELDEVVHPRALVVAGILIGVEATVTPGVSAEDKEDNGLDAS